MQEDTKRGNEGAVITETQKKPSEDEVLNVFYFPLSLPYFMIADNSPLHGKIVLLFVKNEMLGFFYALSGDVNLWCIEISIRGAHCRISLHQGDNCQIKKNEFFPLAKKVSPPTSTSQPPVLFKALPLRTLPIQRCPY